MLFIIKTQKQLLFEFSLKINFAVTIKYYFTNGILFLLNSKFNFNVALLSKRYYDFKTESMIKIHKLMQIHLIITWRS